MGLGQSPPTTSGIVVLSGSNNFGPGSDFPVFSSISIDYPAVEDQIYDPPADLTVGHATGATTPVLEITFFEGLEQPPIHLDVVSNALTITLPAMLLINYETAQEDNRVDTYFNFAATPDNRSTVSTPITTSGIVILDFFPGAGTTVSGAPPYMPPAYLNTRIFPVVFSGAGERLFPEENRRIYPVLPQFSVITPGD